MSAYGIALGELGRVMRATRAMRGVTMEQAAKQMGTSASTICRVENGSLPIACDLVRFATWLRVPIVIAPEGAA